MSKINVLISSCLLGNPCRYDGKSKPIYQISRLKNVFNFIPICPEVMGGLSIPRVPCERINDMVVNKFGKDMTLQYITGAKKALKLALSNNCKYAILKEKSPSCGTGQIYDGSFSKTLTNGVGVTTKLLTQNGICVIGESQLSKTDSWLSI